MLWFGTLLLTEEAKASGRVVREAHGGGPACAVVPTPEPPAAFCVASLTVLGEDFIANYDFLRIYIESKALELEIGNI